MKSLGVGTLVILILAATAVADAETGLRKWMELRGDLSRSESRVQQLRAQNEMLLGEIEILEQDPTAVERVIREELDQALPGEMVILFTPVSEQAVAAPES